MRLPLRRSIMGWALAPGIGYCEAGGELVFLDLARDRYFALRGADRAAFERLREGEANDSEAMTALIGRGFLKYAAGGAALDPATIAVPGTDLSASNEGFSLAAGLAATRALYWARRAMRPAHIAATIANMARTKQALGDTEKEEDIRAIASRYAASRWVAPISPRCLVDALALDHILLRCRLRAILVFGVRTNPFAAHSWLQTCSAVLTGTVAEARNFTPILVVA